MLTDSLKAVLRRAMPGPYRSLQQSLTEHRLRRVGAVLARKYGLVVQGGPFAGMEYVSEAVCSSLAPKLLGSYEAELHQVIDEIIGNNYQTVIDVGCAEGYYAVGLAMRLPKARVYAFDIDSRARDLCKNLAKANKVEDRVVVEDECNHDRLCSLIHGRTIIVCDCEGCELHLLDPSLAPELMNSDLLVELHDMIDPKITPTIVSRFADSHHITLVDSQERDPNAFSALKNFSPLTRRTAVAEFRDEPMQWGFLQAKERS